MSTLVGVHDKLSSLRKSTLVRDDESDPSGRIYKDAAGTVYHSVTRILGATAPAAQQKNLEKWLAREGNLQIRDIAAQRGTDAHSHAEYVLKTANKIARASANRRGSWKEGDEGLQRMPSKLFQWGLEKAIAGSPRLSFASAGYARGLQAWIRDNVRQLHACEFKVNHPAGFAGSCDALIDAPDETGVSQLSVCDWKTSERLRSREMITNYCDQLGAYSLGLTELTGLKAQQGIVVIARRTGEPQAHYLSRFQLKQCETQFLERCTDYYDALLK